MNSVYTVVFSTALSDLSYCPFNAILERYLVTYQREQSRRITHSIDVDQVLVPPILAEGNRIRKPMVSAHPVASPRVLRATDRFGECYIHYIRVELANGDRSRDEVICSRWIREDDSLVHVGRVRGHLDQSC